MSRSNSPDNVKFTSTSPTRDSTVSFSDGPPISPGASEKSFNSLTDKKKFILNPTKQEWEEKIVPLDYKPHSPTSSKIPLIPSQQASSQIPTEIIAAVKTQIAYYQRPSTPFFKNAPKKIKKFIEHLKKYNTTEINNQALIIVGSQLSEKKFNPEKDLDIEWMIECYSPDYINHLLHYILLITPQIEKFYARDDRWILIKIISPHLIDLKINYSPKFLEQKILESLADRRIPNALWDIKTDTLIDFKDKALRFIHTHPTTEDYAYALLQLALYKEKYPILSATFIDQIKAVLSKTDHALELEFFKLLCKKKPEYYSTLKSSTEKAVITRCISDIEQYLDSYRDPSLIAFPSLPTASKHAENPHTLFSSPSRSAPSFAPPVDPTPKGPEKFSYAAAAKGNRR